MFPEPTQPTCPWCNRETASDPREGVCPNCGQPCGERVFAVDVFEGRSRPRLILAVAGWFFVLLTSLIVLNSVFGRGPAGDAIIFGLFTFVLLIIAGAETHGLLLLRRGTGPRRLIFTHDGVEVIKPHRVTGVSSATWDDVDRIKVEPARGGGVRLSIYTSEAEKATMRVVTASTSLTEAQVQAAIDRFQANTA